MVEMISSGDFSLAPLEAGILLHHPVETQSRNRRKIGKKSGYLPPVFFPWVSSLFLVLSALTPQAKSWMLSSYNTIFSPVREGSQFSLPVMSNPLRPHGLQLTRLPCPLPTPGATQTHVHRVGDAIQSSHPLSSPSTPAFNLSQHQGLFQWVSSLHQVAKVLEFQLQHQSFQWIFRTDFL